MSFTYSLNFCLYTWTDQWSPLNPEGKKHYDREFLLQFQYESAATSKPAGLPDIPDIVLDKVRYNHENKSYIKLLKIPVIGKSRASDVCRVFIPFGQFCLLPTLTSLVM